VMANVRRRAVFCPVEVMDLSGSWVFRDGLELELQHDGVFAPVGGLIIPRRTPICSRPSF
jgi:hypothetical protein